MFVRRSGTPHFGAGPFRQLHRDHTDAACNRRDEYPFTGLHVAVPDQRRPRCGSRYRYGGALFEGHRIRQHQDVSPIHCDPFGEPAAARHCTDPVTDLQFVDARGDLGHHTCHLEPADVRDRDTSLVVPQPRHDIREVQTSGMHFDLDLTGRQLGLRHLLDLRHISRPVFANHDGTQRFHSLVTITHCT